MEHINGQNNELTLIFPHGRVNCISAPNERFAKVVNRANITIAGNNNQVSMCFESEDKAEELLLSDGFLLIVKGDNNIVNVGTIILRYSSILGMTGLKLIIGQLPGLGAGVSRVANNCRVDIGDRVVINGVTLYLQENDSRVSIGCTKALYRPSLFTSSVTSSAAALASGPPLPRATLYHNHRGFWASEQGWNLPKNNG